MANLIKYSKSILDSRLHSYPIRNIMNRASQTLKGALADEREKIKNYEERKSRSMWDEGKVEEPIIDTRMDDAFYKPMTFKEREFSTTWSNFPDSPDEPEYKVDVIDEEYLAPPTPRRRRSDQRPMTAQPFDEDARQFITQWDSNQAMVYRNRHAKPLNYSNSTNFDLSSDRSSSKPQASREKQFYY